VYSAAVHGGSGYFDGSGDTLTVAGNTALDLTGDFTIESWANMQSDVNYLCNGTQGGSGCWRLSLYASTGTAFFDMAIGSWAGLNLTSAASSFTKNVWAHFAVTRSGNTFRLFINGAVAATATNSGSLINTGRNTQIGYYTESSGTYYSQWYLSNLRIVKGTAVYTAVFTPSATPLTATTNTSLLLNFTNAAITDATARNVLETVGDARISTVQSKWTGGSMYFATGQTYGSGDNLVVPFSPIYSLDTGDFTVEGWFYFTNLNTDQRGIVALGDGANGFPDVYNAWSLVYLGTEAGGNNQIRWYRYDGTNYMYNTSGLTLVANTWTHIAVSRGGGVLKIFVGGVSYYSQANSQSFAAVNTNPLRVGLQYYGQASSYVPGYGGPRYWPGYISDLRITKGHARYTANFTPPTGSFRLK
jgi:hypothetical protein